MAARPARRPSAIEAERQQLEQFCARRANSFPSRGASAGGGGAQADSTMLYLHNQYSTATITHTSLANISSHTVR